MDKLEIFINDFTADVAQEPFLMLTALFGLISFALAVAGVLLDLRTHRGTLSRGAFLCIGLLLLASSAEVLLSYADERKEERDQAALAESIRGDMQRLFDEYAEALSAAYEAQEDVVALEARGNASNAEVEAVATKLETAFERLNAFENRWRDRAAEDARTTGRSRHARVEVPTGMERMLRRQKSDLKRQELECKLKAGIHDELDGLAPAEVRGILEGGRNVDVLKLIEERRQRGRD